LIERIGDWVIEVDPGATRAIRKFGRCDCSTCRNWEISRDHVLGPSIRAIFERMGIDRENDLENFHYNRVSPGVHSYGGWYLFVGKVVSKAAGYAAIDGMNISFGSSFPGEGQMPGVTSLEFLVEVPWLLDEAEPK
jgi:hypothetical protein